MYPIQFHPSPPIFNYDLFSILYEPKSANIAQVNYNEEIN